MASKKKLETPDKQTMTLSEAARYLKLTPGAITRAVQRGRLVPRLISIKQWRLLREDLDTYAQNRKKGGRPRKAKSEYQSS